MRSVRGMQGWRTALALAMIASGCGGSKTQGASPGPGDMAANDASSNEDTGLAYDASEEEHDAPVAAVHDASSIADSAADVAADHASGESECAIQSISAQAGLAQSSGYSGATDDYDNLFNVPCATAADCVASCVATGGTRDSCDRGSLCLSGEVADSGLPNHCLPPCYWLELTGAIGAGSELSPAGDEQAFDNGYNDTLMLTQFGFTVPDGATILGIEFAVDRSADESFALSTSVSVLQNGTPVGANRGDALSWPTTFTKATYGGPADTWGVSTWTPALIDAPGFGVAITPQNTSNSTNGSIHVASVTATVHYRACR